MTAPDDDRTPDDEPEGAGVTGALAAASEDDAPADDPLSPLDRLAEDDGS